MIVREIFFRYLPTLIFAILLGYFVSPFSVGIVNLGNCAGAVISLVFALAFLFRERFMSVVSHLCENKGGKILVCAVGTSVIVSTVLAVVISCFMVSAMNDSPKGRETTLVLLGCKVKDGRPSLMLQKRINSAYDYMKEHQDVKIVVSGGKGDDEIISEAQCMRDTLVSMGIAPERIFMEDKSVNTKENLEFSLEIIKREGLPEKMTIITDGYHQLRAEMLAVNSGAGKTYNISAKTSRWLIPTYWVREWFGVAYYFLIH